MQTVTFVGHLSLIGQSSRCECWPATSAMDRLPDIGRESWLSGMYDFLSDRTRPTETWVAGLCYGCGLQSKLTLLLTGSFRRGRIGGEGGIFQEAL